MGGTNVSAGRVGTSIVEPARRQSPARLLASGKRQNMQTVRVLRPWASPARQNHPKDCHKEAGRVDRREGVEDQLFRHDSDKGLCVNRVGKPCS